MASERPANPAVKFVTKAAFDDEGNPKPGLTRVLNRTLDVNRPLVLANLKRLRKKHPDATAKKLAKLLQRDYLAAVTVGGGGIGATAVVPGIGTVASLGLSAVATGAFLEASAFYAQSIAELHGVHAKDPEKTKAMVMAIMLGEEGSQLMQSFAAQAAGRGGGPTTRWGLALGGGSSTTLSKTIMASIRRRFIKRYLLRSGGAVLGRALPFGVGAVIGGGANLAMGRAVVKATADAFGEVPDTLPGELVTDLQRIELSSKPSDTAPSPASTPSAGTDDASASSSGSAGDAGTDR
ncbi:hypothetical protein GCM10011512_24040 [Tersicoccus solisilvae]|uniref:Di-and tripeptidase n=1 Tax=Tersicoccus solisilvae TaxID=1882339 RepID=A0ABQ1PFH4_9MICC|nr:hypothetical protein [Tersicoccus solisilvae]GGC96209.1 hypothetical protein GCM10011512_24040 [Tersicoccus solisilvae]